MGKLIKKEFLYEEWSFSSQQEAETAAHKEAVVCGDKVDVVDGRVEIRNWHQGNVRWRGYVQAIV